MGCSSMHVEEPHIGRRVRELRTWRNMTLTATAGLAGVSVSYLSMIERGERSVTKRAVLEAIAQALRVSPADLTAPLRKLNDEPHVHTATATFTDVLSGWWIGETPDAPARPLPEVLADVHRLGELRAVSDYVAQAEMLPRLIRDLLAAAGCRDGRDALAPLISAYWSVGAVAGRWGISGLPALASDRIRQVAEYMDDPIWIAVAAWVRAHFLSGTNRRRQYELAVAAVDLAPPDRLETRGMSHLTAALAATTQGHADVAESHLDEASALAERFKENVSQWPMSMMSFGRTNVGIWRVSLGVEMGQGARVAETAERLRLDGIMRSRQGTFWIDYGRALLTERQTRDKGVRALLRAADLAPQQLRANVWAREAVTGLRTAERRAAGGRELRALALRMGIAPTG
jgi:transcriptional regulator with XRE-family HTH domain